jgi:phosphatidate cytidylyltransferase
VSALGKRVLTALVLLPVAVAAILWLPNRVFALALAVVVLAGGWEWGRLAGWTAGLPRGLYTLGLAAALLGAALLMRSEHGQLALLGLGLLWWLVAAGLVARFERAGTALPGPEGLRALAGVLVLVPAWAALVALHGRGDGGPAWVLFLAATVWGADTGAFFVGRRWGRRRLAARVSPGKSWEGVAGGMLAAVLAALLAAVLVGVPSERLPRLLLLVIATVAASVIGDLTESLFKREVGVKDSGSLLPGHGGVLDRIDSLTAAAPVFTLGLLWVGGPP